MDREKMKCLIKYVGVLFSFALSVLLVLIFTVAYFYPSKTVTVAINAYGEADFEFYLLWLIVMPAIVTGHWLFYQMENNPAAEINIKMKSRTENSKEEIAI